MACRQLQGGTAAGVKTNLRPYQDIRRLPWMVIGWVALVVYVVWNVFWLSQGSFAPSLFKALFGLPAPTTGLTRSLLALSGGDLLLSLHWNPLAVPILVLFITTLALAVSVIRGTRTSLPHTILILWAVVLGAAWVAKFAIGPEFW